VTTSRFKTTQPENVRPALGLPGAKSPSAFAFWRSKRTRIGITRIVAVATLMMSLQCELANAGTSECDLPPKILVMRGVFEVFSLGMNDLAKKLRSRGYDAKATSWSLGLLEVECSDQQPIVLVGHSLGGRMCRWVPRKLRKCGKRVPLVIIVDANLMQSIPDNVDKCLNLHVTNSFGMFHGTPVRGESTRTNIVNWDVSKGQPSMFLGGVNHFNIDATAWVHDIIIEEIARAFPNTRFPPAGVVPAKQKEFAGGLPQEHAAFRVQAGEQEGSRPFCQTTPATELEPAVVIWSPYRTNANYQTVPQGDAVTSDGRNGAQLCARTTRIQSPNSWRAPSTNVSHLPAAEGYTTTAPVWNAEELQSKPPRIRFPRN
jgi:hypothetical protein